MGFTCSWLQQFVNLLVGEGEVAAKRVDATAVNAMGTDIERGIGLKLAHGDDAVDAGSGFNQTVITVKSDNARTGVVQAGDMVLVRDSGGTGWWYIPAVSADNIVSFNDLGPGTDGWLVRGLRPFDYSAAGFIDALHIIIFPQGSFYIPKYLIDFTDGEPGAVQTDDLVRPGGVVLEAFLNAIELAFNAAHDAITGAHLPNVIDNANLDPETLLLEGDENIIAGRFEYDDDDDGLANGWLLYNTPTLVSLGVADHRIGALAQQIITGQPQDGIYTEPDYPHTYEDFLDDDVSFGIYVAATEADTVVLEVFDGVGTTTRAAGGTVGATVPLAVTHHVAPGATCLRFRVWGNKPVPGTTFRVDGAKACRGRLQKGYTSCIGEVVYDISSHLDYEDGILNGDFTDWTNTTNPAAAAPPDWWINGANPPANITRDAVNFLYGVYGYQMTLNLNQSVIYNFLNPLDYRGQDCYLTGRYLGIAGVNRPSITIDDGVAPTTTTILPVVGGWKRFVIPYHVDATAAVLSLEIANLDAGVIQFVIDGLMWTRGIVPAEFKPASAPKVFSWDFNHTGAIAGTNMSLNGTLLEAVIKNRLIVHKLYVYNNTAPGMGSIDTYDVMLNGAPSGLSLNMAGVAVDGAVHLPAGVLYVPSDRLQVLMTPDGMGSAAANISASVEGFRLGY